MTEPAAQAPFFRYGVSGVKKLNYKKKTCATRMKMYNVGTLDASRCQAQWATAEPLLRQAASSSPICKRGRHEPTSTRLLARQSGSPVEAEVEKERGRGSVAMARDARARAGESSSYTQNPCLQAWGGSDGIILFMKLLVCLLIFLNSQPLVFSAMDPNAVYIPPTEEEARAADRIAVIGASAPTLLAECYKLWSPQRIEYYKRPARWLELQDPAGQVNNGNKVICAIYGGDMYGKNPTIAFFNTSQEAGFGFAQSLAIPHKITSPVYDRQKPYEPLSDGEKKALCEEIQRMAQLAYTPDQIKEEILEAEIYDLDLKKLFGTSPLSPYQRCEVIHDKNGQVRMILPTSYLAN